VTAIFVSYRRRSAEPRILRALTDAFVRRFGPASTFLDNASIPPGARFPRVLQEALRDCRAMVVVIDPDWTFACDDRGRRRLDEPDDWVRLEIETALGRQVPVFPVLLDGASMPKAVELPPSMAELADTQAVAISSSSVDTALRSLMSLCDAVEEVLAVQAVAVPSRSGGREADWSPAALAEAGWLPMYERMSRPVAVPPHLMWNRLVDVDRYPDDMDGFSATETLTPGPVRAGFRALLTKKQLWSVTAMLPDLAPMLRTSVEIEFLEVVAPCRFAMASTVRDAFSVPSGPQFLGLVWLSWDGSTTVVHLQAYRHQAALVTIDLQAGVDADDAWLERAVRAVERAHRRR